MKTIELYIDEENEFSGIEAISVVENPAIEEDFIALKKQQVKLAEVDKEKRILMGAALVPNKKIYRTNGEDEYNIFFSEDTVRKASELFLSRGKQNNSTLEHDVKLSGLSVVESWIIEDKKKDKSRKYGFNLPIGTWMVSVKVNNDEIWNDFVKEGKVKGFSIEGFFADKLDGGPKESVQEDFDEMEALSKLYEIEEAFLDSQEVELESYNDYPEGAVNNAKRALKYKEENGSSCGTSVGWTRASQLANKKNITRSTIARMASFKRHQQNKDVPYSEGCGGIMWDAWGGSAGVNWAISKLKQIDKKVNNSVTTLYSEIINDDYAIIDDRLAYSSEGKALEMAKDLGCELIHEHEYEGKMWYMPCKSHSVEAGANSKSPCWDGYEQKGYQMIDGKKRANCVKKK
tara:strand:- start:7107 stop:8315 length:1209 start_codon:yes stop_codon:yes gene_type:complete